VLADRRSSARTRRVLADLVERGRRLLVRAPLHELVTGRRRRLGENAGSSRAVVNDGPDAHLRENVPVAESLRGQLLIAAPSLFDYFRRTVVLVLEHSAEGAMGVVLNRESETRVAEAVPALASLAEPEEMVRIGGPVSPQSVVALGDFGDVAQAGTHVVGSLGTVDPDAEKGSLRRVRVYAGYAGWSAGQLDDELEAEAWLVLPARPQDPFEDGDIWSEALRRKGGSYRLLATMPADPSMN
jgi:putative transcriptional regulator